MRCIGDKKPLARKRVMQPVEQVVESAGKFGEFVAAVFHFNTAAKVTGADKVYL